MDTTTTLPALEELRPGEQWVCFIEDKTPISPITLKGVSGELVEGNPDWTSYEEALGVLKANPWLKGVGREFIKRQRITGIDLEHCVDEQGKIALWAQAIIDRFHSYTEYSLHDGIHIAVHGIIPTNIVPAKPKPDGIEAYDHARYFIWTNKHVPGTPTTIEDRQEELLAFYMEVTMRRAQAKEPAERAKTAKGKKAAPALDANTLYGLKALQDECGLLAHTAEGARNEQLNTSASSSPGMNYHSLL
jgi:primase-polymerase (primpol)-like protein